MPSEEDRSYRRPRTTNTILNDRFRRRALTLIGRRSARLLAANPRGYLTYRRNRIHNNLARQPVRAGELWATHNGEHRPFRRFSQHHNTRTGRVRLFGNILRQQNFRPQVMRQGVRVRFHREGPRAGYINRRNFRY